jgi:hypothetical protein
MRIEVRGYSSRALFPKKQYALELDRGDARLLGLPADTTGCSPRRTATRA